MASGNRVEELESRVKELEATVDGLTDELVECKVRIRELESAVDAAGGLDAIEGFESAESDDQSPASTGGGDVIEAGAESPDVGGTAGERAAEAPKSEAPEDGDETESDDSDIIIA